MLFPSRWMEWFGYHIAMDILFMAIWRHFPLVLKAWPPQSITSFYVIIWWHLARKKNCHTMSRTTNITFPLAHLTSLTIFSQSCDLLVSLILCSLWTWSQALFPTLFCGLKLKLVTYKVPFLHANSPCISLHLHAYTHIDHIYELIQMKQVVCDIKIRYTMT